MKIYIGFSIPINFSIFASLIKWVDARPYDHTYIRLPDPMGQGYLIFQSSSLQVNLYNSAIFQGKYKSLKEYELNITDAQYKELWSFVVSMLGVPYNLKGVFGILLMKIFHLSKQPFNKDHREEFCSELAARVCQMLGIDISEDPSAIDPSALDKILSNTNLNCIDNPNF
jgi:hypothetical protein